MCRLVFPGWFMMFMLLASVSCLIVSIMFVVICAFCVRVAVAVVLAVSPSGTNDYDNNTTGTNDYDNNVNDNNDNDKNDDDNDDNNKRWPVLCYGSARIVIGYRDWYCHCSHNMIVIVMAAVIFMLLVVVIVTALSSL